MVAAYAPPHTHDDCKDCLARALAEARTEIALLTIQRDTLEHAILNMDTEGFEWADLVRSIMERQK